MQALGPNPQVVADGHGHAESTEGNQYRDRLERARPIHRVRDPLRRGDHERREREPVPAQPQQHAGRGGQRHEEEDHRAAVARDAGQHRRREGAEDAERRDAARLPADRQRRGDRPDADRQDHREQLRHQVVDLRRDRHGHEQTRDARRDAGERCIRARLVLVQPDAEDQQARRNPRHRAPCAPLRRSSRWRCRGRTGRRVRAGPQGHRPRRARVRPPDPRTPSCRPAGEGWGCSTRGAPRPAPRCADGRGLRGLGLRRPLDERRPFGLRPRRGPLHYGHSRVQVRDHPLQPLDSLLAPLHTPLLCLLTVGRQLTALSTIGQQTCRVSCEWPSPPTPACRSTTGAGSCSSEAPSCSRPTRSGSCRWLASPARPASRRRSSTTTSPASRTSSSPRSSREPRRSRGGPSPIPTCHRSRRSPAASTRSSAGSRRTSWPTAS